MSDPLVVYDLPGLKRLIRARYYDEGPDLIAAETGYARQRVMNVASQMGVVMSDTAKRANKLNHLTTREHMEQAHSDVEKLALYLPWQKVFTRELREPGPR